MSNAIAECRNSRLIAIASPAAYCRGGFETRPYCAPHAYCEMPRTLFLLVQFLDEPALIQLGDETWVHELFGFAIANLRLRLRDVIVGSLESLHNRIRRGNKILLVDIVRTFEKLPVIGSEILAQNLQAEVFVGLQMGDAFNMRFYHPHHRVAIFLNAFPPRDDRHGRIDDFLPELPQN